METKDYNFVIDGRHFFDQPLKINLGTYDNFRKIVIGQGDNYTTVHLLDFPYLKKYYKLIAVDLSKHQKLDAYLGAIKQINFTGNPDQAGNRKVLLVIEEAKETVLDFSKGTVKVLWLYIVLI